MTTYGRLGLTEVERQVCDLVSVHLGIPRHRVTPSDRIIEDLRCDSLSVVELLLAIEEAFAVTLPDRPSDPVYKAVFTRQPFRLSDLAELVYLRREAAAPGSMPWSPPAED